MKRLCALSVTLLTALGLLAAGAFAGARDQAQDQQTAAPPAADDQNAAAPAATAQQGTEAKAADQVASSSDDAKAAKDAKAAAAKQAKDDAKAAASKSKNSKNDPEAIGDRDVGKGIDFYSLEKEIAMGKQMAQEVERQAKLVDDPIIAEYVNRIGQNLVRNSDAKVPFTIKVIDSEEVNAFALPGGFFFVNTGVILKADNEAELAGVMAHEIAHVAARHGTKNASKATLAQLGTIPLIFLGGWTGYAIRQGAGLAIPIGFLAFTKTEEREADYLGLQYLYKTGYDPTCFVDFFEKIETMEKKKPGTMSKVFATHPMTDDRIKSAQEEIQKILAPKPEYVINTSEFNDVKNRLAMLQGRRKVETGDPNRPQLRRAPGSGNGPAGASPDGAPQSTDSDDRPTLKRRDN
ncbi:MAG: M48 family metallopeptidase [Bryobacteraceae bacterium]|jgi:predicted Zn-dependent protease